MRAVDTAWDPNPDIEAATVLGDALRAVGYTTDAIEELLGEDGPAADLADSVVFERRLPSSPIATGLKLLLLERPVAAADATAAPGTGGLDAPPPIGVAPARG